MAHARHRSRARWGRPSAAPRLRALGCRPCASCPSPASATTTPTSSTRDGSDEAFVVDPSEAEPVIAAIERAGLSLVAVVNTHHHPDHVGGNEGLLARYGELPVYAHASDHGRIPAQTEQVEEGRRLRVAGLDLDPLHVPGHTTGAVAYVVDGGVFTGDTLFVAGCGRLFEGTPAMMNHSLNDKLARLPPDTRVYCGHEYTVSNLRFAVHAEPDNRAAAEKLARAGPRASAASPPSPRPSARSSRPTPSSARASPPSRPASRAPPRSEVFAAVRRAKDTFR